MIRSLLFKAIVLSLLLGLLGCVTKKKRGETSTMGKFYHNTTSYYNGYWNAKEIFKEGIVLLRSMNKDDYNEIIEVEDFVSIDNPKAVKADMDRIIDKVATVAQLHLPSDWVDDCYVMMAKAQYVKQEYETAEETLEYFQEDFNPSNPYGRNYKNKKLTGKAGKKQRAAQKKEKEKQKKIEQKEKLKTKEAAQKTKEQAQKEKAKERERLKKEKEKQKKIDAKNRKKGIKPVKPATTTPSSPKTSSETTKSTNTEKTEEKYSPPAPEKKPEEDKTAYSEGLLWLAKTYIKRENWFTSQLILDKLSNSGAKDEVKGELPATYASLYIKQNKYAEALPKILEAVEEAENKNLKARYYFIAGQLSQRLNDFGGAQTYFELAKKYTTDPSMEFISEMSSAKNGIVSGKISKASTIEQLRKMLAKDKYANYLDKIYFTIAEIELQDNQKDQAIANFKNSVQNNKTDTRLKAETYNNIAKIYYHTEDYSQASAYYDSTFMSMDSKHKNYNEVKRYAENLKDIAYNINLIKFQDTLLYFASLEDKTQKREVKKYIATNGFTDGNDRKPESPLMSKNLNVFTKIETSKSNFFAYNPNQKTRGKENFNKVWGNRPLSDNWRKLSSIGFVDLDFDNKKADDNVSTENDDTDVNVSTEDLEKFINMLPNNPSKRKETNTKVMDAMFTLGKLYRDKVNNYAKSASTLEKMLDRFSPTPYDPDALFYLYLNYQDLNNAAKSAEYASRLSAKFPQSKYAQIINDPSFATNVQDDRKIADNYYRRVYKMFETGYYQQALDGINNANKTISDNHQLHAKFALLRAMCVGNIQGKEAYITALNEVITGHPNTPEQAKAREILRFLGGDNSAFANIEDVDKIFTHDPTAPHYVIVITYKLEEIQHVQLKVAISEFNKSYFSSDRLQFGDATLNVQDQAEIILVRRFENEDKAVSYVNKALANNNEFSNSAKLHYEIYPISQQNYRKVLSEKSITRYRAFYENYINKNK